MIRSFLRQTPVSFVTDQSFNFFDDGAYIQRETVPDDLAAII